jgi:hypothetical protein
MDSTSSETIQYLNMLFIPQSYKDVNAPKALESHALCKV